MKKLYLSLLSLVYYCLGVQAAEVQVVFSGLESGDKAGLILSSGEHMDNLWVTSNGTFTFHDVPAGKYSVKAEASGYNLREPQTVIVYADGSVIPIVPLKLAISKMSQDENTWNFTWKEDESPSGYTTTSHVNQPKEIEFLGKKTVPADVPSFGILQNNYHVFLSDDEEPWSQEHAYRLTETFKTLPLDYYNFLPAKFTLTKDHIENDILVTNLGDGFEVKISQDAFTYANPFLVNLDGVKGALYSKRLHHALTNFVTDFGKDEGRVDAILSGRFNCRVIGIDYMALTAGCTDEDEGKFQPFLPSELVSIINMFEEMPEGFHAVPHLNYLIRRMNGHKNPLYPEAAAVAWCKEDGYIEFMENAFDGGNNLSFDTLRLILHEKSHFLWAYVFSEEIKKEWTEIGGWYPDPNNGGWSTTKDTEFVTAYAHAHNPDEDMAESVAYYIKDPDLLQSRSLAKFEFVRDRIMHGVRYISAIPDHLSFEVLNLWPDYDYPGKINGVSVEIKGAPEEDKIVTMEITLNHIEGYQDGASNAYIRLTSPTFYDEEGREFSQFYDIGMYPVEGDPYKLRGETTISKYSKMGYWGPSDITVTDLQGNARYEGRNDCVVSIYINNPLEDIIPPSFEKGSLNYELTDTEVEGHPCQNLKVTYKVHDNIGINKVFARIYADIEGFNDGGTGLTDHYGTYDPETHTAEINILIKEYYPTGDYYITFVEFYDAAETVKTVYFSDSPQDDPIKKIHITTPNPDLNHPEVDLNRIFVYAEPTHPEAPDGETIVTVNFYVRDDISGFGECLYQFLDPQGIFHGDWFYHKNFNTNYFEGDPTLWEHYQIKHILPRGSAPGRWGLAQLMVGDKAGNRYTYNFIETLIFEPTDSEDGWDLFTDLDADLNLSFALESESEETFGFNYRVINERNGKEINGKVSAQTRAVTTATSLNISELGAGNIILIVTALDEGGQPLKVMSERLSVVSHNRGDSNGDGWIDIVDVVNTSNYILGKEVVEFSQDNADVNNDGKITVSDVTGTVSLILGISTRSDNFMVLSDDENTVNDKLLIEKVSWTAEEEASLPVYLKASNEYVGIQFDINLDGNIDVDDIRLSDSVAENHSLAYAKVSEKVFRVVIYDLDCHILPAYDEPLIFINLNRSIESKGEIILSNIIASDKEANRFTLVNTRSEINTASVSLIEKDNILIIPSNDGIIILNAAGKNIIVASIEGVKVAACEILNNEERIKLNPGLYVVKIGALSHKVLIK